MADHRSREETGGFTLVELLVVLGILALLAGLLLPAVHLGRKAADRAQCLNRTRNLALAVRLYTEDSGGVLPGILPGRKEASAPWLRQDHLPAASLQSILADQMARPNDGSAFCCPVGKASLSKDPAEAVWGESAYQWFLGPRHGWVRMNTVREPVSWPLVMDPFPGLHDSVGRMTAFLDGHSEIVSEFQIQGEKERILEDPSVLIDPALGCRYFPEDCGER